MESQSGEEHPLWGSLPPRESGGEGRGWSRWPVLQTRRFWGRSIRKRSDPWSHCLDSGGEWVGSPLRQGCLVPSAPAGPAGCEVGRGTQVRSELRWGPRVLGKACRKEEEKI